MTRNWTLQFHRIQGSQKVPYNRGPSPDQILHTWSLRVLNLVNSHLSLRERGLNDTSANIFVVVATPQLLTKICNFNFGSICVETPLRSQVSTRPYQQVQIDILTQLYKRVGLLYFRLKLSFFLEWSKKVYLSYQIGLGVCSACPSQFLSRVLMRKIFRNYQGSSFNLNL